MNPVSDWPAAILLVSSEVGISPQRIAALLALPEGEDSDGGYSAVMKLEEVVPRASTVMFALLQ